MGDIVGEIIRAPAKGTLGISKSNGGGRSPRDDAVRRKGGRWGGVPAVPCWRARCHGPLLRIDLEYPPFMTVDAGAELRVHLFASDYLCRSLSKLSPDGASNMGLTTP